MLRIVTLNSWKCDGAYGARLDAMASGLAALNADVICLQECFATLPQAASEHGNDAMPAADTASALAHRLDMGLYAAPARRKRRIHKDTPLLSTSGLAILTRLDAGEMETLALPTDPRDGERIAQSLILHDTHAGLRVVNTHLTHLRDAGGLRAAQIEAILNLWCNPEAEPVVIAGDLNAPLSAPELEALRHRAGLDRGPVPPGAWPATLIGAAGPGRAVDHILLLRGAGRDGPRLTARRLVLDTPDARGVHPSDHAGVLATIDVSRIERRRPPRP